MPTSSQAAARLAALEANVKQLSHLVADLPGEDQAVKVVRTHRLIVVMFWMLLIPMVASAWFLIGARDQVEENRRGVRCVLEQIAEHRVTNQIVHDNMARALGVDPTPLTPLPARPTAEDLRRICSPFLKADG